MKYTTSLFDLDGTIADSEEGIIHSIQFAIKKMKLYELDKQTLQTFIGPPLKESFMNHWQLSENEANQALTFYREYYQDKGIYENIIYTGVKELLEKLQTNQFSLYIATSKPEYFAKKVIHHFRLNAYFKGIYGASMDGRRSKKAEVIKHLLVSERMTELDKIIMIGDRSHDIIGGKENRIATMGVLYGFGTEIELRKSKATYLVSSPKEIESILLQEN